MTPVSPDYMTPEEFDLHLEALLSNARLGGLTEQELAVLPREAAAELVAARPVSRIVRRKVVRAKPRPTPAIQVSIVVWRSRPKRWRRRIVVP
jgi:hypothetical protein